MEVAGADDDVLVGENGRVVGDGVDLGLHDILYVLDSVFGGTVHLRHTAEGIRILHVLFVLLDNF